MEKRPRLPYRYCSKTVSGCRRHPVGCIEILHRPLTGQLADKPTRDQSSRGLDNSQTGQLADSEFLKIMGNSADNQQSAVSNEV